MQKLAEVCIRRPVFACMLILALLVVGGAAYTHLGVDRLPSVDLPTVSIRTTMAGATPEEMESEVTDRVEQAVNTVEGITELRSISTPGNSMVMATFKLSRDIDTATQDIRDRIATIQRDLQRINADPPVVMKNNNDDAPIITIALSGKRTLRELTEMADKVAKVQLERASGVGDVGISGSSGRVMNIWLDAKKLAAYQLPVTAVRDAIARQNANTPGGNVTGPTQELTLRTIGKLTDQASFDDLIIATINKEPIRLRDIGRAEDGPMERRSVSNLNGEPTVVLEVRRQSGANTIAVIEAVKESLTQVQVQLPPDVKLEIIRDQSRYIYSALHEINLHLVLGSILACLVVLLFMRNWRSTLIAGIAIPTSVVASFGVMWMLGFTLNSVTMLALVLMVGVVIDDAIVVLENIFRFVEEKKMNAFDAAREATREIGLAVMATTFSLVVIFIPVSFMSSISGRFLYQFGITAAVAVLVSLLVSFTLTPMMSARLIKVHPENQGGHQQHAASRRGFYGLIDRSYEAMLAWTLRHRPTVSILAILIVASSVPLYGWVKQEFVPSDVDEAEFQLSVLAPEGASLEAMEKVMAAVDKDILTIRGVRVVLSSTGAGWMGMVNTGNSYIRIAPHEERIFSLGRLWHETLRGQPLAAFRNNYTQRDVMQEIRKKLSAYKDLRITVRNFPSFSTGGSSADLDMVFKGPDLVQLYKYADELREKTRPHANKPAEIPGVLDADTTLKLNKPELLIHPLRDRAGDMDVSINDIGNALRLLVGGDDRVSRFRDESQSDDFDVRLRLEQKDRLSQDQVTTLYIPRRDGTLVDLTNVAEIEFARAPSRIDRLDRQRTVALRASVAPGFAQADRIAALRQSIANMNLPPAYTTTVTGRAKELEKTFTEFLWAFLFSVILMYIILAMNYESLIHPVTILLSLPLTIPFALLSLYLAGGTLNLYSALGILVLFGVVKKNAILQIDHMNGLRAKGMPRQEAILQANRDRLRPILMTTLALIAGMLPLALGSGPGSEERRAVAIVVIGGQSLSLLLTLLVTPVAYSILDDVGQLLFRRKKPTAMREKPRMVVQETL